MNKFHRYISFSLCLALIIFCFSPIYAHALVYPDPIATIAYIVFGNLAVDGISEGAKVIASALTAVWNKVFSPELLQTAQGILEIGGFFQNPSNATSHYNVYKYYTDGELSAGQVVLSKAFLSSVSAAYKAKTGQTLPAVNEDVTIYVPPESVWTDADLITYDRLKVRGFSDLTEVNKNILAGNQITWQLKEDFNSLQMFLRTDFAETLSNDSFLLRSAFETGFDNLSDALSYVETAVDTMSSTLHKDLTNLSSNLSTLGNNILSNLGTLNSEVSYLGTSVGSILSKSNDIISSLSGITSSLETLNSLASSGDISDLKDYYSSFGDGIRYSINSVGYDVSSLVNYIISLDLGLSDLISQTDVLYKSVSSYLHDIGDTNHSILSSLSSLADQLGFIYTKMESLASPNVTVDLTQISVFLEDLLGYTRITSDFVASVFSEIESLDETLSFTIADSISSLGDTLTDHSSYIQDLYLNEYLDIFASGFDSLVGSLDGFLLDFESLLSDTSQLVEVSVNLATVDVLSDLVAGEIEYAVNQLYGMFSSLETTLTDSILDLKTDLLEVLSEIKTSVKAIAGTTTAGPGTGDDSQDDYEKEKSFLIPWIGNGFELGGSHFNSVQGFLGDEIDAFLVAGMIFEEFAGMTFFYKLIITSCSVGLIGTLLGMALNVAGYSVAQRRREEAAQSKAHSRMERSAAA